MRTLAQLLSWLLQGGAVAVPRRLLAYLDGMDLTLEEWGALTYLLYIEGCVKPGDARAERAVHLLEERGFVLQGENGLSFEPMLQLAQGDATAERPKRMPLPAVYARLVKRYEQASGRFLSERDKRDLLQVLQKYGWPEELVYQAFLAYADNYRRKYYTFSAFCHMAGQAGVETVADFQTFCEQLDYGVKKVREVLQRIGKYNQPTEAQKNYYMKWQQDWSFSHEMILLAADETINADNPSIGYIDRVLESWHKENFKTPQAVYQRRQEREAASKERIRGNRKQIGNRDFQAHTPEDYDSLEE